jgi:DNA-directed RNA polymerase specialized sigma24 family protein
MRNSEQMSYEECARVLGISPARVRQLEARALMKMRVGLEKLGVRSSDLRGVASPDDLDLRGSAS